MKKMMGLKLSVMLTFLLFLLASMCFILTDEVYAIDSYHDCVFDIEDEQLKKAMAKYDVNGDGILYKSEYESVAGELDKLVLDETDFSSLRGMEHMLTIWELHMKNCGFDSLPTGIEDVGFYKLFLNDNNLQDSEEVISLLNVKELSKEYIYLSGNPCFDEVVNWDFNYRFYNLSIIGSVGETYWQKSNERSYLIVDYMDSGIIEDAIWEERVIGEADFSEMKWEFSIEDESIAQIEGEDFIEREFEFDPYRYAFTCTESLEAYRWQKDTVIKIKLLKEGRTKMKISCGDYVKYTDIIVLPEHNDICGAYAMNSISDLGLAKLVKTYTATTYSGIYRDAYDYFNKEKVAINGNVAFVKDFSSLSDMKDIEQLTFLHYTPEMLTQVINLEGIQNLNCIKVKYSNTEDNSLELYQCVDEKISELKGNGWYTIFVGDYVEAVNADVNGDEYINAKDSLDILKYSASISDLSEQQVPVADINKDEKINSQDALRILEIVAGLI